MTDKELDAFLGNEEKEIRDMARVLCTDFAKESCVEGCAFKGENSPCFYFTLCTQLYEAGYRKADEVRKKTAEHILGALYDITFEREWDEVNGDHDEQKEVVSRAALINMAKDYGVELPE